MIRMFPGEFLFPSDQSCFQVNDYFPNLIFVSQLIVMFRSYVSKLIFTFFCSQWIQSLWISRAMIRVCHDNFETEFIASKVAPPLWLPPTHMTHVGFRLDLNRSDSLWNVPWLKYQVNFDILTYLYLFPICFRFLSHNFWFFQTETFGPIFKSSLRF